MRVSCSSLSGGLFFDLDPCPGAAAKRRAAHLPTSQVHLLTDGSAKKHSYKDRGSYGWVLASIQAVGPSSNITWHEAGGGLDLDTTNHTAKVASARTEALAVASGLAYLREKGYRGQVHVITDNDGVVKNCVIHIYTRAEHG